MDSSDDEEIGASIGEEVHNWRCCCWIDGAMVDQHNWEEVAKTLRRCAEGRAHYASLHRVVAITTRGLASR